MQRSYAFLVLTRNLCTFALAREHGESGISRVAGGQKRVWGGESESGEVRSRKKRATCRSSSRGLAVLSFLGFLLTQMFLMD